MRGRRGWAPNDTWDFDHYLARVIYEGITHLKDHTGGYPAYLGRISETEELDSDLGMKRWEEILEKIAKGFKIYVDAEDCETCGYGFAWKRDDNPCEEHPVEAYEEAWDLLRKYFMGLWD